MALSYHKSKEMSTPPVHFKAFISDVKKFFFVRENSVNFLFFTLFLAYLIVVFILNIVL